MKNFCKSIKEKGRILFRSTYVVFGFGVKMFARLEH